MNNADDVIYTNGYKPKEDACVELYNGKFVDGTKIGSDHSKVL